VQLEPLARRRQGLLGGLLPTPSISIRSAIDEPASSCTDSMPAATSFSLSFGPSPSISWSGMSRARSASWRLRSSLLEMRSIFQPVSLAARRAFWPPLPMASESWSSATTTWQRRSTSITRTSMTLAGDSARLTKMLASEDQGTMSMRSPPSSRTMLCTREPLSPTHEPTASTRGSCE